MAKKKTSAKRSKVAVMRILNCLPSRDTDRDWTIRHARAAGVLAAGPIPPGKDLREDWWKIGDQESTGSCVGWATADSVLRWHFVKSGDLQDGERLSPRFVWMAAKETDAITDRPTTFIEKAGTTLKAALDIARKFGVVREPVLPFKSGQLYPDDPETFYAIAARLRIASYFSVGMDPADWRDWIANHGPILTRLDVDATWDDAKAADGNLDEYLPGTARGGHAVAIVGYTPDRFIVRNSWGTATWGDKGFGYASTAYAQDAFTEAYGVTV